MRLTLLFVLVISGASCARHHVIERSVGRVDGERSIASSSDEEWSVKQTPADPAEQPKTR